MITEAQRRAKRKYRSKCKSVTVQFHPTESEIFAQLEKQANKSGYIKELIRADMERSGNNGKP